MSRPPIELEPAWVLNCPECGMASMVPGPKPDLQWLIFAIIIIGAVGIAFVVARAAML